MTESTIKQDNITVTIRFDGDPVNYPSFETIFDMMKQAALGAGYSPATVERWMGPTED